MHLSEESISLVNDYFESYLTGYSIEVLYFEQYSNIYILNDSLILLFEVNRNKVAYVNNKGLCKEDLTNNKYIEPGIYGNYYYSFRIVELTNNEIGWKYNNEELKRKVVDFIGEELIYVPIEYVKFKGWSRNYWSMDTPSEIEYIDKKVPKLRLKERYEKWEGIRYYFIYIEFKKPDNTYAKAVAYSVSAPRIYINTLCKNTIKTGKLYRDTMRGGNYGWMTPLEKAFNLWKGVRRVRRLEENLTYFFIEEYHKEKSLVWERADELANEFNENSCKFDNVERSSWLQANNKWISEELVYRLTKKLFKEYKVVYQMRPFFLRSKTTGAQLSYDIFISGLNVAIEYQGIQHFQPIEFFGGEKNFERQLIRDREKYELSKENNVYLVYINYDEEISEELIKNKVNNILNADKD